MKKLIINQKNLPRVKSTDSTKLKQSDSSIRIRINKTQLPHQTVPLKKSPSSQLQDIEMCLQVFQKSNGNPIFVDQEKIGLMVQLLRSYKQTLTANQQLMTQSLRFSKLKFKTICEGQQKQNITSPLRTDKNNKQISQSDPSQKAMQKPANLYRSPKNKRLFTTCKKNIDQKQDQKQHNNNQLSHQQFFKQYHQNLNQSQYLKLGQYQNPSSDSLNQNQIDQKVTLKLSKLQQEVNALTNQEIKSLTKQIKSKNQEIKELNDRIQQLNLNIQNLIKKNSVKADEYNKLYEEYSQIKQNLSKIPILQEELNQMKQKCINLEQENKELERKKQEAQKNWRKIEREKNEKIEQELGRYETAQQFYQLTRRDLKEENQNLLNLLEQRQREITYLYQVFHDSKTHMEPNESKIQNL